jgi:glycosyltransferase involved in cell wall biosynthesis
LAGAITGVPLVYHVHSPACRDSTRRWQNHINALIERISLSRASALIAVSESLAEGARRQGFAAEKVWVVANGVPCPVARPPRPIDQTDWTLGTAALFRPRKGIEVLLGALAILRSRGMSVRFRAVGGFETPEYERLVKGHAAQLGLTGAVDWTGFASDVDGHLRQMDVFVLPSLFGEGLPMAVLEAMAAGVPVVASRVDGVPDVIRNGVDGLLVQPGDPLALAETISRIIRREIGWSALQASALKRQAERFSDRSMAAGVAAVYRRVLARKG